MTPPFAAAFRFIGPALAMIALGGCAVGYGKIPHGQYTAPSRCNPAPDQAGGDAAALPLFIATSRLPDCRADAIVLLHHRGDRMRYGRFAAPTVKGKAAATPPLAFSGETAWWQSLREETARKNGRVLLYVHGYRETFASAARDTAQIAAMTGFDGPVIAYSWPSQGRLQSYAVDETNMYWDQRNFAAFLKTLADQPWADEIIIVSHSLGARLVLPGIDAVDRTTTRTRSNLSNIILASPDIDRDDFERDVADTVLSVQRVDADRRIHVYTSLADRALSLSRSLHGYPRLGSPFCFNPKDPAAFKDSKGRLRCYPIQQRFGTDKKKAGLLVIDTTDVSRSSTGHSDFLRSAVACDDFVAVVNGARDRPGRTATAMAHVVRLAPDPANPKPDDAARCKMPKF